MSAKEILKQYFGFDEFREGQADIIEALTHGWDAFGVMPTGAGKSLCYQVPAMLLPGVTFVISPLISLMPTSKAVGRKRHFRGIYNHSLTDAQ